MKLLIVLLLAKAPPVEAYQMPPGIVSADEFTDVTRMYECTHIDGWTVRLAWGEIPGRIDPALFVCVDGGENFAPTAIG